MFFICAYIFCSKIQEVFSLANSSILCEPHFSLWPYVQLDVLQEENENLLEKVDILVVTFSLLSSSVLNSNTELLLYSLGLLRRDLGKLKLELWSLRSRLVYILYYASC